MKEIELKDVGFVSLRELTNNDREIIQNEGVDTVFDENGAPLVQKVKSGTITKYTFILGIAKAPFFTTELTDLVDGKTLKSRLEEYNKIDHRIIQTVLPYIRDVNKLDETDFEVLKKN